MHLAGLIRTPLAGLAAAIATSTIAAAVPHSAADRAWIATCVADRRGDRIRGRPLERYCICMQEVVETNEPLTVMELERAYPPAHAACVDDASRR